MTTRRKDLNTKKVILVKFIFKGKTKIMDFGRCRFRNPSFLVECFSKFLEDLSSIFLFSKKGCTMFKDKIKTITVSMPIIACFSVLDFCSRSYLATKAFNYPIKQYKTSICDCKFSRKIVSLPCFVIFSKFKNGKTAFTIDNSSHVSEFYISKSLFHGEYDNMNGNLSLPATTERGGCLAA